MFCTVIKSFQNRIQHALLIYFGSLNSEDSIVARKDPTIAYSLVFIGAELSTMHCMQTCLSTYVCYQVDIYTYVRKVFHHLEQNGRAAASILSKSTNGDSLEPYLIIFNAVFWREKYLTPSFDKYRKYRA